MKINSIQALNLIMESELRTCSGGKISDQEKRKLKEVLDLLEVSMRNGRRKKVTLVFRGDDHVNLSKKLSNEPDTLSDIEFYGRTFYFGDKAKHHYRFNRDAIIEDEIVSTIEACTIEAGREIFARIQKVLKDENPRVRSFIRQCPEFEKYFSCIDNLEVFAKVISNELIWRDYYLYFLHTAGRLGISDASFLVSSSTSFYVASSFGRKRGRRHIIYYVIPHPIRRFAVSHSFSAGGLNRNNKNGLPTYGSVSLYPYQQEVALRGALFPHHILGILSFDVNEKMIFVPNPHLFTPENNVEGILTELKIDQSGFDERLNETGYSSAVELCRNGKFRTI